MSVKWSVKLEGMQINKRSVSAQPCAALGYCDRNSCCYDECTESCQSPKEGHSNTSFSQTGQREYSYLCQLLFNRFLSCLEMAVFLQASGHMEN